MRPARFVTVCFLYAGLMLVAQQTLLYPLGFDLSTVAGVGVGLSVLATGLVRLWNPETERQNPAEYGLFTYGMAVLCVFLTGIFVVQLLLLV